MNNLPDYIAKVEGHGNIEINFSKNQAHLVILEGERLFEGFLVGNHYQDVPMITSRICGICPTAHYLTSLKAIESALDIKVTSLTINLRKLLLAAQIIQSHLLHIYFLVLPDYYHIDSSIELSARFPTEFALILNLKKFSDDLLTIIGGRAVHLISPIPGGFAKQLNKNKLQTLFFDVKNILRKSELLVKIFTDLKYPKIQPKNQYIALSLPRSYAYYSGLAKTSDGELFSPADFQNQIKESVRYDSSAKFAKRKNKSLFVGALARINLNNHFLHPRTQVAIKKFNLKFPTFNPFHNILAQSLEILNFLEEIEILLTQVLQKDLNEKPKKPKKSSGFGVGYIEAPRGTLYHQLKIKDNIINQVDIITPTVQNLTSIEQDVNELLKITKDKPEKERKRLCEMLIRAYDPCITCSVH